MSKVEEADKRPLHEIRLEICLSCPAFFAPTSQCKECGCFLRVKTRIKTEMCPIGKW